MTMSWVTVLFGVLPIVVFMVLAARSTLVGRRRGNRGDGTVGSADAERSAGPQHTDQTRGDR